ncbi:hypothetical protein GCM10027262_30990 [Nocardia tengchongensis]
MANSSSTVTMRPPYDRPSRPDNAAPSPEPLRVDASVARRTNARISIGRARLPRRAARRSDPGTGRICRVLRLFA